MSHQVQNNKAPIPPPRRQRSFNKEKLETESLVDIGKLQIGRSLSASTSSLLLAQPELLDKSLKDKGSCRPNRVSEISSPVMNNREKLLRRSMSTQPYIATNLLDKITLEATMLSIFNASYSPEDALQCNDGSTNVLPNSKLDKTMGRSSSHEPYVSENLSNISLYPNEKFHCSNGTSNESQMKDNYLDWSMNAFKNIGSVESSEQKSAKNLDINNAIAINEIESFVQEHEIDAKYVLNLLQYEFGDNIYCQHLPTQDKELIKLLRKTSKEEKLMAFVDDDDDDAEDISTFTDQLMEKSFSSHEKNLLIPVQIPKHNYITRERRDSAIDELSSWFDRSSSIGDQN